MRNMTFWKKLDFRLLYIFEELRLDVTAEVSLPVEGFLMTS